MGVQLYYRDIQMKKKTKLGQGLIKALKEANKTKDKIKKLEAQLQIAVDALDELNLPYTAIGPNKMPRFPDEIIREALAKIKVDGDV
jgi:hypothetical protein